MNRDQIVDLMSSFWLENLESQPAVLGDRDEVRRRMSRLFDEVVSPNMKSAEAHACVLNEASQAESAWAARVVKKFLRRC